MPKDDFWDIDNISVRRAAPLRKAEPRPAAPTVPTRPASEKAAAASPAPSKPRSETPEALTILRYAPENTLLDEVKIGRWPSHYSFYEQFLGYARNYFDFCPGESEYLPFFSFMPQYQQMTRKQLCYYGWWRENLREGRYLRTDYCYILLYIYEVLNLPDLLPPERGARELALLWANYREEFPRLDKYLAEWLCDYCLIHRQPCPRDILEPFLQKILPGTTLREFYLADESGDGAAALMELHASYQFRFSKYRTEETRDLFEKHIPAAMTAFLTEMGVHDPRFLLSRGSEPITVNRDSYVGAVCAFRNKRQITVTYRPVVASGGLSPIITDAVKSCENGVRAALGIRARFRVAHLSAGMQAIIDRYFARYLPPLSPKNAPVVLPDGSILPEVDESAYEKPKEALSAEAAKEIEYSSRSTAELLGEEEEPGEDRPLTPAPPAEAPAPEQVADRTRKELTLRAMRFLLLGDMEGLRALAESRSLLADTLVGQLNDEALTRLGDVIAEQPDGTHWQLIEDYREDLTQWIRELEISTTNEAN